MTQREVDLKATVAALMALPGKLIVHPMSDRVEIGVQSNISDGSADTLTIYNDGYISGDYAESCG